MSFCWSERHGSRPVRFVIGTGLGRPLRLIQLFDKSAHEPIERLAPLSTEWEPRVVRYFVERTLEGHEQLLRFCRALAQRDTDLSYRLTLRRGELLGITRAQGISKQAP